jgi:hypothetical protein
MAKLCLFTVSDITQASAECQMAPRKTPAFFYPISPPRFPQRIRLRRETVPAGPLTSRAVPKVFSCLPRQGELLLHVVPLQHRKHCVFPNTEDTMHARFLDEDRPSARRSLDVGGCRCSDARPPPQEPSNRAARTSRAGSRCRALDPRRLVPRPRGTRREPPGPRSRGAARPETERPT